MSHLNGVTLACEIGQKIEDKRKFGEFGQICDKQVNPMQSVHLKRS